MWLKRLIVIGTLLGAFLTLPPTSAFGQEPDPVVKARQEDLAEFFENVKSDSIGTAYEKLLENTQLGTEEDRAELVKQTADIKTTYGAYRGFKPVYTKRVGDDLIFMKYLYKCERFPVLWHFTFYRASTNGDLGAGSQPWQVVSIRFDTDLEILTLLTQSDSNN
jgi:hypothetical protein